MSPRSTKALTLDVDTDDGTSDPRMGGTCFAHHSYHRADPFRRRGYERGQHADTPRRANSSVSATRVSTVTSSAPGEPVHLQVDETTQEQRVRRAGLSDRLHRSDPVAIDADTGRPPVGEAAVQARHWSTLLAAGPERVLVLELGRSWG